MIQAADTVQKQGPVLIKTKEFRWNSNKSKRKHPIPNDAASYVNLLFILTLN